MSNNDVVIVQPSFDDHEARKSPSSPSPVKGINQEWQSRSPQQEKEDNVAEVRTERSPSSAQTGLQVTTQIRHRRNLSDHFYDAAKLDETPEIAKDEVLAADGDLGGRASGRKHRRLFSDDSFVSHGRIDSFGASSVFGRPFNKHQRVDSAGLDILSAVADATKEELASAAGQSISLTQENPPPAIEYSVYQHPPPLQPHYRYSHAQPVDGRSHGYSGLENPHMHPPNRRVSGPGGPPALPSLGPPARSSYGSPLPHRHPHGSHPHSSGYPPHLYQPYPHTAPPFTQHQHHSYYRQTYPSRVHAPSPLQSLHNVHSESDAVLETCSRPVEDRNLGESVKTLNSWSDDRTLAAVSNQTWRSTSVRQASSTTQGSQTFVTAIAVGEGNKTMETATHLKNASTNTDDRPGESSNVNIPSEIGGRHRRGMSSFSSIGFGTIFGNGVLSPGAPDTPPTHVQSHPLQSNLAPAGEGRRHHRATSSVSFLNSVLGNENDVFLRNLQESIPEFRSPVASTRDAIRSPSPIAKVSDAADASAETESEHTEAKLAPGGTSKRVRRKCTINGCINRVVQGGLCIQHGAKRKLCGHEGCTKSVKKAGFCSTHGPARKRCSFAGCPKVAVQGGQCIQHGAKKKLCSYEGCQKQAILKGMCKKHHDNVRGKEQKVNERMTEVVGSSFCREVTPTDSRSTLSSVSNKTGSKSVTKPSHTRGLSIFHDISADTVSSLLNESVEFVTHMNV